MRTVSDLLLSTIIEKRPLVLLLGQNAWSESRDTEPLLSRALDKLGRIDRTQSSWKEIISDQAPPPDYMDWLAERFDRRVHPEFVETLGALPWSAIFTSALDPTLPKFLSVGGREAEPILTASEIPRAARSTARPPLYYLFSRAGERDPRALPPTDQIELSIRRTQHAIPLLNRMLETATSLGTIVVDGFHLSGDWLRFEEMLGTLASASVNQVLWFGGYPDLQNDDKSTFETLERTGRILVEPLRLGSVIAELKATGRLDDVIQAETEDVGTISFGDNSYLGITPENRLRVEAAASVVDDSWTSFLAPMGPDASYDAFRRFHGVLGGPRLLVEGVRRGFAITRDFERELLSHIYDALADHSKLQAPIIVEGQSGTGKSVALARIVARIRESKASPVLYALGRIPQPQDVASFCQSAERAGAQATLIVCDANRDVDSYDELLSGLRSRGRRVVVIGSQYREATQEEANTYLQLEAPVLISENERAKFSSLLGAYFENADYRQLEDNHFLAALYRCLPASRPRIGSGLSAEARSSERRLYRRGNQPRAVLPITRLHQQLIEKGFIKDHQPILGKHETESPAELEGAAGRIIDFVMVAGSLNCPVPVNLLLRAATEQYGSIDSTLVSDLFRNLDLFRWESSDSEGNEWLIMPRLTLEAQLICQRRLGSAQAEADCLLALIGSVRQGIDNSQEREFLSTLLQQIRRHGPSGNRYIHSYMAFARKLTELREHFNVVDANLMLQESAFRRSAVQGEQIEDATDLELLEESLDAVQTAIDEINNGRLRAGRRTRQSLLVERAAIFGYLANYRVQQEGKADEVWSAYRATRVAIRQAMSAADDYYPLDVGLWAPADLFKTDILTESQKAELAADIYSTMDLVEEEALPPSQRNRFQQRRMSVGITLADQGLTEDAYAQLEASGSTAGYFLRAREYAPDLSKDEVEVNSDSALQEAKTASDFLEERFDRILHDERCLSLLLECRWICEMHRRPLRGEGQPLPVGISRRHILEIVRALNLAAGESSRYGTRYLEAVLTWLTEDYFEAREIFRQLDHDTDNVYRRRIFKRHLISSPTGVPESFSGRVVSQVGEGRWRISVNELNQTIALLESDFPREEILYGRTVSDFAIAFNFIGPIAHPIRR